MPFGKHHQQQLIGPGATTTLVFFRLFATVSDECCSLHLTFERFLSCLFRHVLAHHEYGTWVESLYDTQSSEIINDNCVSTAVYLSDEHLSRCMWHIADGRYTINEAKKKLKEMFPKAEK
eukprot:PhM_4_TR11250/c0_g1_i1/m.70041